MSENLDLPDFEKELEDLPTFEELKKELEDLPTFEKLREEIAEESRDFDPKIWNL